MGLRRVRRGQRGFAAIAVLTMLIVTSLYSVATRLNLAASSAPHMRESRSIDVLNQAKAALIAFAAENANRPGGLPCPDRNGDGEAELNCDRPEQRTGWYPWQTLKTGDLRDASGNRLWYGVAAGFRNDPNVAINSLTPGELSLVRSTAGGKEQVAADLVAVVIAPGVPLAGQERAGAHATRIDSWLDGENARVGGTAFETGSTSATFNDVIMGLSQAELFSVVDRIVATRIRREIAPLLRQQVFDAWQALPYAVPFSAPSQSNYQDSARLDPREGLLPVTRDSRWVNWDVSSIRIDRDPGISNVDCGASIGQEIRCDVTHAGASSIRITAVARNVGRALVRPVSAADEDFGPSLLIGRQVLNNPVDVGGNAQITASATLPGAGGRTRITLRAPRPIEVLTNPSIAVAAPHSWFARNEWHRALYYAASPVSLPGGVRSGCQAGRDPCLSLQDRDGKQTQSAALLVFMGRPDSNRQRAQPHALTSYLEGENATPGDGIFRDGVASTSFNDSVIVLCAQTNGGCK